VSVPAVWCYLFVAIILGMFTRPWGFLGPVVLAGYLILSAACVLGWKVYRRRERAFLEWVAEKEALSVDGQRTDRAVPPPDSRWRHQLGAVGEQSSRNAVGLRESKPRPRGFTAAGSCTASPTPGRAAAASQYRPLSATPDSNAATAAAT
jgi:hypothetical protein